MNKPEIWSPESQLKIPSENVKVYYDFLLD